MSEGS